MQNLMETSCQGTDPTQNTHANQQPHVVEGVNQAQDLVDKGLWVNADPSTLCQSQGL